MSNILKGLGIYEQSIIDAADIIEMALENNDLENEINGIYREIPETLNEIGDWNNITNSIILALFSLTKRCLEEHGIHSDYYVNGEDSHFYINDEEVL